MNYDNTNRGQIWPNDRKETDKHPDFKGSLNVEGEEYWVSAWKRAPGANPKAPSLRFSIQKKESPPVQKPARTTIQEDARTSSDWTDDEIPFSGEAA